LGPIANRDFVIRGVTLKGLVGRNLSGRKPIEPGLVTGVLGLPYTKAKRMSREKCIQAKIFREPAAEATHLECDGCFMRISKLEHDVICQSLLAADPEGAIFLFGSRMNDADRGGDIDIYFETRKPIDLETQLALEYRLCSLCDTKIDLLIKTPESPDKAIFAIARNGLPL